MFSQKAELMVPQRVGFKEIFTDDCIKNPLKSSELQNWQLATMFRLCHRLTHNAIYNKEANYNKEAKGIDSILEKSKNYFNDNRTTYTNDEIINAMLQHAILFAALKLPDNCKDITVEHRQDLVKALIIKGKSQGNFDLAKCVYQDHEGNLLPILHGYLVQLSIQKIKKEALFEDKEFIQLLVDNGATLFSETNPIAGLAMAIQYDVNDLAKNTLEQNIVHIKGNDENISDEQAKTTLLAQATNDKNLCVVNFLKKMVPILKRKLLIVMK